jgi:hypothetical protein
VISIVSVNLAKPWLWDWSSWMKLKRFLNYIHIPTRAKYDLYSNSCLCWALLRDVSIVSFEIFWKWFSIQIFLLASPNNIGVHNSILEYASTANIYTTPHFHNHGLAIPFHLKRNFWRVLFSLFIIKILKFWKRRGIEKREREKSIEKRGRKIEAPRVSANKKGKSIFG